MPIEIRIKPLAELKPAPYNPRVALKATDRRYQKLAASLREFGLVEPLIWNEATGHIVGGHARLKILQEMGVAEVPVSVVNLTLDREKALNVVLNNLEAQGRFEPAKLADLLTELADLPEFELTGFEAGDLADLKLAPIELSQTDSPLDRVEITLATDPATYERLAKKLDQLVAQFDLVCHVCRS